MRLTNLLIFSCSWNKTGKEPEGSKRKIIVKLQRPQQREYGGPSVWLQDGWWSPRGIPLSSPLRPDSLPLPHTQGWNSGHLLAACRQVHRDPQNGPCFCLPPPKKMFHFLILEKSCQDSAYWYFKNKVILPCKALLWAPSMSTYGI